MKNLSAHEMILASAGSGKTYALVSRYISLLAGSVEPGKIRALTFTRKAAGEFRQNIFLRLTEAAENEGKAAELSKAIGSNQRRPEFFHNLLEKLVHQIENLHLGTIDQFFAQLAGAFPYELELSRPHQIMDEFEQDQVRQATLDQLLREADEKESKAVLQLYKDLTWGAEGKVVYREFDENLKNFHNLYLEAADLDRWGNPLRLYREADPWWLGESLNRKALVNSIRHEIAGLDLGKGLEAALNTTLERFPEWQPGQELVPGVLLPRLLKTRDDLRKGNVELAYNKKRVNIGQPLSGDLYRLIQVYIREEIQMRMKGTASLGEFLEKYDAIYRRSVRQSGRLVFADLPMLLLIAFSGGSSSISSEELLYRLDTRTDHWLLDEFQDTSRIQWGVLRSFIDEVLQDPSGRRTSFFVGDIKQSIYRWRGGDARLFKEIAAYYSCIRTSGLHQSWRSASAVLDCVNILFKEGIEKSSLPQSVRTRWLADFEKHQPSPTTEKLPGYAAWGLLDEGMEIGEACANLIRRVNPLENGRSCAVLVRKNSEVTELSLYLETLGMPTSMEGKIDLSSDNVVGCWIRGFLLSLARPGERFPKAYSHGLKLPSAGTRKAGSIFRKVRGALSRGAYGAAVQGLIRYLDPIIVKSEFLRLRAAQILEVSVEFERMGEGDLESFITYLGSATISESSLSSHIQVMTVHKAKGLTFDMTIVAGFGGQSLLRQSGPQLHVERALDGEIEWVLRLPNKVVRACDDLLRQSCEGSEDDELFESLCQLYVAVTRPRYGLYLLAPESTRKSSSPTWEGLLASAFGKTSHRADQDGIRWQWQSGKPDWMSLIQESNNRSEEPEPVLQALTGDLPSSMPILRLAASPSREAHGGSHTVRPLISSAGRNFGTRMHDFLATIEWLPACSEGVDPGNNSSGHPEVDHRFREFCRTALAGEVFAQPHGSVVLWREKPYILRRGNELTQGIVDRAVLYYNEEGAIERAVIFDFKTDQLDPALPAEQQLRERYDLQVQRYTEALCTLTGLLPESVDTVLVPV